MTTNLTPNPTQSAITRAASAPAAAGSASDTARSRRARPARAGRSHRGGARPDTARRRDGVALAATGRVPDRLRSRVLAEHYAARAARSRDRITRRIASGTYPLTIPYGYRRTSPGDRHDPLATWALPGDSWPAADTDRGARSGRAAAHTWTLDPATTLTVRFMATWVRAGVPVRAIAARLAADPLRHPRPLTTTGTERAWSAARVRAVLSDPLLTGHSVWGRTRQGRPVPPTEWVISEEPTHPGILPAAIWQATRRAVTGDDGRWWAR